MATLKLTADQGGFYWQITGFSQAFSSDRYIRAGISTAPVGDDHDSEPDIIGSIKAWAGNTATSTNRYWVDYDPDWFDYEYVDSNTIRVYGFAQTSDGLYWEAGSATVTITTSLPVDPWSWTTSNGDASATQTRRAYQILSGTQPASAGLSHLVWNDLVDKVAEVREAYGYSWTTVGGAYLAKGRCYVNAGDALSAAIYNSVRYQIGSIPNHATSIPDRVPGDEILGYHIIHMVDVLNDIIENP